METPKLSNPIQLEFTDLPLFSTDMSHPDGSQDHAQYGRLSTRARVKKERLNVLNPLVDQICQQLSRHGQDLLKVNWRDEMERLFGIKYNASSQIGLQEECIENEDDFEYLQDHLTQLSTFYRTRGTQMCVLHSLH